jgi:hypothetical protein
VLKPVPETVELAARVVNEPVLAVEAPMLMLLIVLAAVGFNVNVPAGLIATVPVPVGLIVTVELAGLSVTALDAVSVVNEPLAGVVAPTVPLRAPLKAEDRTEPFHVMLAEPAKTPLLLNCTCVLEPPAAAPAEEPSFTKSLRLAFQATTAYSPLLTFTPVVAAPFMVTAKPPVVLLSTT